MTFNISLFERPSINFSGIEEYNGLLSFAKTLYLKLYPLISTGGKLNFILMLIFVQYLCPVGLQRGFQTSHDNPSCCKLLISP